MARRSRMSILKRQRELRKSEKAAQKRAKRHGVVIEGFTEPAPTVGADILMGVPLGDDDDPADDSADDAAEHETDES